MKIEVPFYSQKWDLDRWGDLGFESFEEAKYWERSSCGILCLKMAIDAFLLAQDKPLSPPIKDYIKKGIEIGAYKDSTGWNHGGLVDLAEAFGFSAESRGRVGTTELHEALESGFFPIVSIKWAFENERTLKEWVFFWKKIGGHLALVVGSGGSGEEPPGFFVHHTSIRPSYNWQNKYLPVEKFKQGFTGRCIFIKKKT